MVAGIGHPKKQTSSPAAPAQAGSADDSSHEFSGKLVLFRNPSWSRKAELWEILPSSFDGYQLVLDPRGRFLFADITGMRSQGRSFFISLTDEKAPEKWWATNSAEDNNQPPGDSWEGKWRSGIWPVWETLDNFGWDGKIHARQIYTAPGRRSFGFVDLPEFGRDGLDQEGAKSLVRVVKDDGVGVITLHGPAAAAAAATAATGAIDVSKRWEGTGGRSLRRLSDGEELIFDGKTCAHTAAGAFDCALGSAANDVYLLGKDPLSARVIRGEQIAHLYYHPNLIEDFFDGKPVAPHPATKGPLGLPPKLLKRGQRYLDGQSPSLAVTLLAQDGGDGVAGMRVWVDGKPLPLDPRIRLVAEKPTPVTLNIPPATCGHVRILSCNTQGYLCSPAVDVPFCPKQNHIIKETK